MEDEEDTEVMALVERRAKGGSFYKKSGRERGPFRRRGRRRRGEGEGGKDEGGER